MVKRSRVLRSVAAVAVATMVIAAMGPATADPGSSKGGAAGSGYNAIPSKVSGNVTSVSFEGAPADELGDLVALGGKARTLDSMSVLMSSWGCETGDYTAAGNCQTTTPGATFDVPLTFTIYDEDGVEIVAETATVAVPYRPSASAMCTGTNAGRWYNSKDRTCYSGLPHLVTVDMSQSGTVLPERVIWSVKYNTTTSGYSPVGNAPCVTEPGGCGYDTLNVGVFSYPNAPFAGTDVDADEVFFDGVMQSGWEGYRPLGAIATR